MSFKDVSIKNILKNKVFNQKNLPKYALILGMLGITVIFFSSSFKSSSNKPETIHRQDTSSEQKRENLEKNLEKIVSQIEGAGNAKALVTLESGVETVYAAEKRKSKEESEDKSSGETTRTKHTNDCEKKFITVKDSQGGECALEITQIEPKIKGVVIICPGGDDAIVKKRIIDATTTALNVSANKVCVTKSG